ncbi:hypothetical protein J2Z23_003059 [Lederbergia galactosidilyticus]|nr:hypothetical protein [Lederbergia galactosidilytica]
MNACFVLLTTSWKIVELLGSDNRPIPQVARFYISLEFLDEYLTKDITCLFIGNEKERIESAKLIIG